MFDEQVRAHRRRLGMTQQELAAASGLGLRTIREAEAGRVTRPRPSTVRLLADAFGLSGPQRDGFHQAALPASGDHPLAEVGQTGAASRRWATAWPAVPAQLPADVPAFTGRDADLDQLDAYLADPGEAATGPTAVMISAVSGTAGVGKTALAIHWAHRARGRFPDGQLYVNLRGYDPDRPMTADEALAQFLGALGVASQKIPLDLAERAARYRTEMAGRRMLVVLDNASSVEQVRPLLPGTSTCVVVVTSRDSLAGLVAVDGAHRVVLDLLAATDAVDLLRRLIGIRVDGEPDAAAALADHCARLPLALRVAAELVVSRPTTSLATLVAEVADQQRRLDLLDAGGDPRAAVATVFSWSIQHLPPDAVRIFGLLGLHPGPGADAYAVAALADIDLARTNRALGLLTRAHLIHPTGPGRWGMHDLLRAYANGLATQCGTDGPRAALGRLFDFYLATAGAAMDLLQPGEAARRPRVAPAATPTPALTGPDDAREWLDTECPALVAMVAYTANHGWPTYTVRLSTTLFRYFTGRQPAVALAVHTHARQAARQTGDRAGQAEALIGLGAVHMLLGRYGPAAGHYGRARALFGQVGDRVGEARALNCLGIVQTRLGRNTSAADHYRRALTLFGQAGDRVGEADALLSLGEVEEQLGRHALAADHFGQALARYQRADDRFGMAETLNNLGLVQARLGRYRSGVDQIQQAMALFRGLGNRAEEAVALDSLGTIHLRLHQPERAVEAFTQALALFRDVGAPRGEARALNGLGEAAHSTGNLSAALAHHTVALAVANTTGSRDEQARAHTGLGHVYHARNTLDRARWHYAQAVARFLDLGMPEADDLRAQLAAIDQPPLMTERTEERLHTS